MCAVFVEEEPLARFVPLAQRVVEKGGRQLSGRRRFSAVQLLFGVHHGIGGRDVLAQQLRAEFAFRSETLGHAPIMSWRGRAGKA